MNKYKTLYITQTYYNRWVDSETNCTREEGLKSLDKYKRTIMRAHRLIERKSLNPLWISESIRRMREDMHLNVVLGNQARWVLRTLLDRIPKNNKYYMHPQFKFLEHTLGYYKDDKVYTAYDNRTNDCWVESFQTEEEAIRWLMSDEAGS